MLGWEYPFAAVQPRKFKMYTHRGYSFIEVLVSLSLMTSSSLLLMNQHEKSYQLSHQLHRQTFQRFQDENGMERYALNEPSLSNAHAYHRVKPDE